jgi:hypothetical protein
MRKSTSFNLTVKTATGSSNLFLYADSMPDALDDALRRCGYDPKLLDLVQSLDGTYYATLQSSGAQILSININSVFLNT